MLTPVKRNLHRAEKLYSKQIEDMIEIVKGIDITTCGLQEDRQKVIELFKMNIRKGFLGMGMYVEQTLLN